MFQALTSFTNQALKDVPQNWNVDLLSKYQEVTKEDVLASLKKYFLPLFDSASSVVAVVTAPGKTAEITEGLTKVGYQVEQQTMDVEMADGSDASSVSGSGSSEGSQ